MITTIQYTQALPKTDYLAVEKQWLSYLFHPLLKQRVLRFHHPAQRQSSLLGYLMLEQLLIQYFPANQTDYNLIITPKGKPQIATPPAPCFNISHSANNICCAVSPHNIGIDIEQERPVNLRIAKRYFSTTEQEMLFALPPSQQQSMFFTLWTLKESYLKYTGTGLSGSLGSFTIAFTPHPVIYSPQGLRLPVTTAHHMLPQGYHLSVCTNYANLLTQPQFITPDQIISGAIHANQNK